MLLKAKEEASHCKLLLFLSNIDLDSLSILGRLSKPGSLFPFQEVKTPVCRSWCCLLAASIHRTPGNNNHIVLEIGCCPRIRPPLGLSHSKLITLP